MLSKLANYDFLLNRVRFCCARQSYMHNEVSTIAACTLLKSGDLLIPSYPNLSFICKEILAGRIKEKSLFHFGPGSVAHSTTPSFGLPEGIKTWFYWLAWGPDSLPAVHDRVRRSHSCTRLHFSFLYSLIFFKENVSTVCKFPESF